MKSTKRTASATSGRKPVAASSNSEPDLVAFCRTAKAAMEKQDAVIKDIHTKMLDHHVEINKHQDAIADLELLLEVEAKRLYLLETEYVHLRNRAKRTL
jgi:hypothetical protein